MPEIVVYTLAGAVASGIAFYVLFAGRIASKGDLQEVWKGISDRSVRLGGRIDSLKNELVEIAKRQEHMVTADSKAFPWLRDKPNIDDRIRSCEKRISEITKELTDNAVAHARLFGLMEAMDKKLDDKLDQALQYNKRRDRREEDREGGR